MRLRLRSELRVGLSPERLVAVWYGRGIGNTVRERFIERFEPPAAGPGWKNALDALSRLNVSDRARQCEVAIVLSNHFVRYAILPWTPALKADADWVAYARHTLAATYGAQAADWEVRLCSNGHRKARIACGVETALIRAVSDAALESGVRLASIQPYLAVVFNRLRDTFERDEAWLAVQEAGRLTLCVMGGQGLSAVRSRRTHGEGLMALGRLLAREGLFRESSEAPKRVVVCADEAFEPSSGPAQGGVRLEDMTLSRSDTSDLRPYALALS